MDYEKIEKYIQYVLSQVGEGEHTKEDLMEDLRERGLTQEEIDYIIERSWEEGKSLEGEVRNSFLTKSIFLLIIPLLIVITLYLNGSSIVNSHSFWLLLGGIIVVAVFILKKKKF